MTLSPTVHCRTTAADFRCLPCLLRSNHKCNKTCNKTFDKTSVVYNKNANEGCNSCVMALSTVTTYGRDAELLPEERVYGHATHDRKWRRYPYFWHVCHANPVPVSFSTRFWRRLQNSSISTQKLTFTWLKWWLLRFSSSANNAIIVKTAAASSISSLFLCHVCVHFGTRNFLCRRIWKENRYRKCCDKSWRQFQCCVSRAWMVIRCPSNVLPGRPLKTNIVTTLPHLGLKGH